MIAKNISEYIEHIKSITLKNNTINWYRGHADITWELKPTIWRTFSRENERGMNHEFLWKAQSRTLNPPVDGDWAGWLSLMQHYRLPTRLLDWSKSPLIGLYYAIEESILSSKEIEPKNDAEVWVLMPGKLNVISGLEPYIFSIKNTTAIEMIEPAFLSPSKVKENDKIIAVSAIENELRMMVQQSAFTIHSSQEALENYPENEKFLKRIKLPKECLNDIALDLDLLGFKPSNIYPDLENLSKEIKIRYQKLCGI